MKSTKRWITGALGTLALVATVAVFAGHGIAQGRLTIGGSSSNFGRGALRGGFVPDPFTTNITSGGSLDASTMSLAPGCRGFVTAQPDYILNYTSPASFLRFYFRASGDTTLVINAGNGRWHCDDDGGGNLNPMVDIRNPPPGQYDIWVGSYRAGENIRGTLNVTELQSNRP